MRGLVATMAFQTHTEEEGSRILFIVIAVTGSSDSGWSLLLLSVSSLNPALLVANRLERLHGAPLLRSIW